MLSLPREPTSSAMSMVSTSALSTRCSSLTSGSVSPSIRSFLKEKPEVTTFRRVPIFWALTSLVEKETRLTAKTRAKERRNAREIIFFIFLSAKTNKLLINNTKLFQKFLQEYYITI